MVVWAASVRRNSPRVMAIVCADGEHGRVEHDGVFPGPGVGPLDRPPQGAGPASPCW